MKPMKLRFRKRSTKYDSVYRAVFWEGHTVEVYSVQLSKTKPLEWYFVIKKDRKRIWVNDEPYETKDACIHDVQIAYSEPDTIGDFASPTLEAREAALSKKKSTDEDEPEGWDDYDEDEAEGHWDNIIKSFDEE